MKRTSYGYSYRGYEIRRGGYQDTTDNRLDGWYTDPQDQQFLDRRGPGYRTLAECRAAIDEISAVYCASAGSMARAS